MNEGDREVNLLLVRHTSHVLEDDFERIAGIVREREPRIHARVVRDRPHRLSRHLYARRPSLVFAAATLRRFRPARGTVYAPRALPKTEECRRLEEAGIPVPPWAALTSTFTPDLGAFGPYVVVKPDIGLSGAEVKIVRKGRVAWKPPKIHRLGGSSPDELIVQEFVYTGRWPVSYRVVTLLGTALACIRIEADHERVPLEERYAFQGGGGGRTIVASSKGCDVRMHVDEEVVAFAEDAHRAFPEQGLLGFDVIREVPSGRLYVLEVNTTGHTWMFCSQLGQRIRRDTGDDPREQMGAIERAADVFVERTPGLAE